MNAGNGCVCAKCHTINSYADPNQADGSYLCYDCRPVSATTTSAPYRAAVPRPPVGTQYRLALYHVEGDGAVSAYASPKPIWIDRSDLVKDPLNPGRFTNAMHLQFEVCTGETQVDGVLLTTPTGDNYWLPYPQRYSLLNGDTGEFAVGSILIPEVMIT